MLNTLKCKDSERVFQDLSDAARKRKGTSRQQVTPRVAIPAPSTTAPAPSVVTGGTNTQHVIVPVLTTVPAGTTMPTTETNITNTEQEQQGHPRVLFSGFSATSWTSNQ